MDQQIFEKKMTRFPRSTVWDATTQRSIDDVRAFIHRHPQPTISQIQNASVKERPLSKSLSGDSYHLIQDTLPAPAQDDVRQMLFRTIAQLGNADYEETALTPVPVEWVGSRVSKFEDGKASLSKRDELAKLSMDSPNGLTILHVHGGAFFQGSPASYRPMTSKLSSLSRGRVVSVQYRLSPQNAFPAAILDVLVAYLSLLYPSSSSPHNPINPSQIVFAGDSVGGVLLCSVLQILLHSKSQNSLLFHSHTIPFPLPIPSGVAVLSFPGDLLHSLPSYHRNRVHDIFLEVPWHHPDYPACSIWPTKPPRPDIYCPTRSFLHPLITLALAKSWIGAPPMWFASGEELFADGAKAVARKAAAQGVNVTWTEFEAMPHCFPMVPGLTHSRQTRFFMERWATICQDYVKRTMFRQKGFNSSRISFPAAEEQSIELEGSGDLSFEEIERMIKAKVYVTDRMFKEDLARLFESKL